MKIKRSHVYSFRTEAETREVIEQEFQKTLASGFPIGTVRPEHLTRESFIDWVCLRDDVDGPQA